jgi:hypothetical protein
LPQNRASPPDAEALSTKKLARESVDRTIAAIVRMRDGALAMSGLPEIRY